MPLFLEVIANENHNLFKRAKLFWSANNQKAAETGKTKTNNRFVESHKERRIIAKVFREIA